MKFHFIRVFQWILRFSGEILMKKEKEEKREKGEKKRGKIFRNLQNVSRFCRKWQNFPEFAKCLDILPEMAKCLEILRNSARKIRKMLEISGIREKLHFSFHFFHSSP